MIEGGQPTATRLREPLLLLVRSNLVIAFSAVAVAITTIAVLQFPLEPFPITFVFVATLLAYTINRGLDRAEDAENLPGRRAFIEKYGRMLLWLAAGGYLLTLLWVASWRPVLLPGALLPPAAAWAYSTGHIKRLFFVKNVFVGVLWACIPLGLGVYYGRLFELGVVMLAIVFVIVLTVAAAVFDIKDIEGDRLMGARTLPVVLGVPRTRVVATGVLAIAIPVIAAGALLITPRFFVLLGYVVYLGLAIPVATPDRGELFYGLIVDGEHLVVAAIAAWLWLV